MRVDQVDAAIDSAADDTSVGTVLADLLDKHGAWDWSHDSNRYAAVESSGAWWLVYRGTAPDRAWRFSNQDEATDRLSSAKFHAEGC